MIDRGHELTDELLEEMERKIRKEYQQAVKDVQAKLDDYLRRFQIKDEIWQKNVADGKKTAEEYKQWRIGQIAVGKRWEEMRDTLAQDLHNANAVARSVIEGYRPEAYAVSHNYATYEVEKGAKLDTGYTLYDRQTVERIMRNDPELLPPPGKRMRASIAAGKDIAWQEGRIQSVITQSILQGESIPNISKRIARDLGESNHKATIRYARTAVNGAENAGRIDAFRRAEEMGIDMEQEWRATLDMRTRHEHAQLDGQRRKVGEPFEVDGYEIMFPGDPSAEGFLIWNCRCTLRGIVAGLEPMARQLRSLDDIEGMSYEEWKESHEEKSHRITKQEEIAETMRRRYILEDYGGRGPEWSKKPPEEPTIAGVQRGPEMSHRDADTGRVNPHYGESRAYGINCQSCVVTYEARLRGYDVEVVPNDSLHPTCDKVAKDSRLPWISKDGSTPNYDIGNGISKWTWMGNWQGETPTAKRFERKLLQTLDGEGRYTLEFKWKGYNSGHIVTIQKDVDQLVIYDPQSNRLMRGKAVSKYLDQIAYKRKYKGDTYYQWPGVMRIDDKDFNVGIVNDITRKAGS